MSKAGGDKKMRMNPLSYRFILYMLLSFVLKESYLGIEFLMIVNDILVNIVGRYSVVNPAAPLYSIS
jgi:hypothetical protein